MEKKINKKFFSCSGNGKAVPQHVLDEKTMTLKPKYDENGKRVVHNLYDDIQKFKDVNSITRILKTLGDGDIEQLSIICDSEAEARKRDVDYTKMTTAEKIADVQSKLNSAHITMDDIMFAINQSIAKRSSKQVSPEKKENVPEKQSPEKVVKKDVEIKK